MTYAGNNSSERNPDKKTLSIVHLLFPYVKQRIRVGENLGILPRNMYKCNEIIDEVVIDVYEKDLHKTNDPEDLRMIMFDMANQRINQLLESESWHKDSISTKLILEDELKQLEENFTMDADNDLIMNEELDDISYHQNDEKGASLPYDDAQEGVLTLLDLKEAGVLSNWGERGALRKLYYRLPLNTSNIVDLYILGKLSFHEIATIVNIEISEVKKIINFVRETFKKELE